MAISEELDPDSMDNGTKQPKNDNKPTKSNIDQLTEFCANKKQLPGIDKDKLLKFFNHYKDKINNWTGKLNLEQLYSKFN